MRNYPVLPDPEKESFSYLRFSVPSRERNKNFANFKNICSESTLLQEKL